MMPVRFTCLLFALLVAGCGVAEYEKRMKESQERIKRYEEESALISGGITVPQTPKDKEGRSYNAVNMFIRLPKGLRASPDEETRGGLLYVYSPAGRGPGGKGSADPFTVVLIAFADASDATFVDKVMKTFTATNTPSTSRHTTRPLGRPEVHFARTTFESGQEFYSANHWKGTKQQVMVVYVMNNAQQQAGRRAVDVSLETFGGEADAAKAREAADRRSPLEHVPRGP